MLGALATDPPPSVVAHWERARDALTFEGLYVADEALSCLDIFVASATKPTSSQVYHLKISLKRMRNPVWRRVLVPATLNGAFTPSIKTITYRYDFGASWYHDITRERVRDFPIEYWAGEDDDQEHSHFDKDKINSRLAELACRSN